MKVLWNPNPIRTVIELDDADKALLRERIKSADLIERIGSANFVLKQEHQEWMLAHVERARGWALEDFVADAREELDCAYVLGDENRGGKSYDANLDERLGWALESLAEPHDGDCVCQACSCGKCQAEELLGVSTIEGLGKHEAHHIDAVFRDGASTTAEAVERLRAYDPRPDGTWRDAHLDRWREESRRAAEWLAEYVAKHFPGGGP